MLMTEEQLQHCGVYLKALKDIPQNPEYHPEGDALTHTRLVVEAARRIQDRENLSHYNRCLLTISAMLHDVGKATTTKQVDGKIISHGHAELGAEIVLRIINDSFGQSVAALVKYHHAHLNLQSKRAYNRLQRKLDAVAPGLLPILILLGEADYTGRPPLEPKSPFLDAIHKLNV